LWCLNPAYIRAKGEDFQYARPFHRFAYRHHVHPYPLGTRRD
jgi:hypothetical protein